MYLCISNTTLRIDEGNDSYSDIAYLGLAQLARADGAASPVI